jgi:hypothetical protein
MQISPLSTPVYENPHMHQTKAARKKKDVLKWVLSHSDL